MFTIRKKPKGHENFIEIDTKSRGTHVHNGIVITNSSIDQHQLVMNDTIPTMTLSEMVCDFEHQVSMINPMSSLSDHSPHHMPIMRHHQQILTGGKHPAASPHFASASTSSAHFANFVQQQQQHTPQSRANTANNANNSSFAKKRKRNYFFFFLILQIRAK